MENPRISPYLIRTERESPLSYQLLTSTDKEIGRAIDVLHTLKADAVDLNMGCPSSAVSKFGAGVMLMEQPEEVRRIVAEARKRTALPLSAKIRLGSDADSGTLTFHGHNKLASYFTLDPGFTSLSRTRIEGFPSSSVAARSIPRDSTPMSFAGLRFATITISLPMRYSGS